MARAATNHAPNTTLPLPSFPVRVGKSRKSTNASIAYGLSGQGHPRLIIRSSDVMAPVLRSADWPTGLVWSINDRLRSQGAAKGRVLALWNDSLGKPTPVAVLCWHLPEHGPVAILDAGHALRSGQPGADLVKYLVLCLRDIARHQNCRRDPDTLQWSLIAFDRAPHRERVAFRRAGVERAKGFKFRKVASKPAWARGAWLGELRFPS